MNNINPFKWNYRFLGIEFLVLTIFVSVLLFFGKIQFGDWEHFILITFSIYGGGNTIKEAVRQFVLPKS